MQSTRGHRKAIMSLDGDYTNVGLAMVPENGPDTQVGPLVTTGNYCRPKESSPDHFSQFIVGTVWRDGNGNGRYDPGEGVGNVIVTPSQGKYYAVTANSGGYTIPVEAPGAYTVTFSGAATGSVDVMIGSVSVLVDRQEAAVNELHTGEETSSEPFIPLAPPPGIRVR